MEVGFNHELEARLNEQAAQALFAGLMQVRWSRPAGEDLEGICARIERDNPEPPGVSPKSSMTGAAS